MVRGLSQSQNCCFLFYFCHSWNNEMFMQQLSLCMPSSIFLPFIFFLILLFHSTSVPVDTITQTISIQSTNETFYSYIPLSSDCQYPQEPSVQLGRVDYTALDPPAIFSAIAASSEAAFWVSMVNGMRMMVNDDELLLNGTYYQIVLFNSTLSGNLTQRQLILTTFTLQGGITFNYAVPAYNYTTNFLNATIVAQQTFLLGDEIQQMVQDCILNGKFIWITYTGGNNFMGVCPNTTDLFIWNTNNSTQSYIYTNLSFLDGENIQNITNNPMVLYPKAPNITVPPYSKQYEWNVVLQAQDGVSCFFCKANLTSLICDSFQQEQNWLQIVIQRGWGVQASLQLSEIQLVLTQYPQLLNYTFPGNIISIFSFANTLFIQSQQNGATYLAIFEGGHILANTSLSGVIIYYGRENLVVQQKNGTFWMVNFLLPVYKITSSFPERDNYTLQISCSYAEYVLEYNVFWSNIAYPSYLIQQLNTTPQVSYQSVKVANLNDFFMIIGPAFEVFIELNAGIDINLLDLSDILGTYEIVDIISVIFSSPSAQSYIPYYVIFLDTKGVVMQYRMGSKQQAVPMGQPCDLLAITNSYTLQNGFIFTDGEAFCYCDESIKNCQLISPQQLPEIVSQNTNSLGEYVTTLSKIVQEVSPSSAATADNAIKKQLLAVVNQDLIINIYQNNTVTLTNLEGEVIDYLLSVCLDFNSTDGTIFTRNFYDDFLLLYCYERSIFTQYLIRNQQFIFNRVVPLYGFVTTNSNIGILSGQNYVFLQVKLDPLYFGSAIPMPNASASCCILRLDPDQFTVSVIAEIIPADQLITVYSMYGVDVVFYNSTEVSSSIPAIKVYFDSAWISFSQNARCTPQNVSCTPNTYPYSIALISDFYNFAAAFNQNITFNISASIITYSGVGIQDVVMDIYNGNYVFFNSSVNYTFNSFCGPISSFRQRNTVAETGSIFLITENDIVTTNKELTNNYQPIVQVIDIADYAPGNTLAACVMVVGIQNITFYIKYDGVWMDTLAVVKSPELDCLFFVSQIVNNNTVQFGSDCYNLDINTPTVTVTYDPSQSIKFNATFGTMQMPIQLRSVASFIQFGQTMLLGIQQGPSKSISGVLYLCNLTVCNSLTINSKIVFFIDFDQQSLSNGLLVAGLDVYKLSFWINPSLLPFNGTAIPADYVVNYQQQLGYSCSKVKIVLASSSHVNLILSCGAAYQQVNVDLITGTLSVMMSFTKFANCEGIDRFKPEFIPQANSSSTIAFLAVQCQHSVEVVRLEQIYSVNTNTSIEVVTSYLLIYASTGPQCSPNHRSPIRMIDLGTNEQFSSYLIYFANGQWKLLYQQINGILIDNFIQVQPNTYYQLIELTKQVPRPSLLMTVTNPYYEVMLSIETTQQKISPRFALLYSIWGLFIFFNSLTLLFFVCWCFLRKNSRTRPRLRNFSDSNQISILSPSLLNPSKFLSDKESRFSSEYNEKEESQGREMRELQPSNVFSRNEGSTMRQASQKRRGTQIQLFQPR